MKVTTHPNYQETHVMCACGNKFLTRSTHRGDIHVEICSACHPFFTGKQKVLDTAGRLHVDEELMDEAAAVQSATKPIETLLVADSLTGQDAVNSAQDFHSRLGLTGIVLTKMDGDARGGAALSVRAVTGRPTIVHVAIDTAENCFPMIPSGKPHNEMLLGSAATEGAITGAGGALV